MNDTYAVGISTGLLAAAAIAVSPAVPALTPLGVEVVLIAFRTGLHVGTVANHLDLQRDGAKWSVVLSGMTDAECQRVLSDFHQDRSIPVSNAAYISAVCDESVTISGPPSTLKQLLESPDLLNVKSEEMEVHGPYHASHLHSEVDVEKILKSSDSQTVQLLDQYKTRLPVQSTSTGSWFDLNMGARKLLTAVVRNILVEPLRMGQVLNGCVDTLRALKCLTSRVISCGPTGLEKTFVAALQFRTDAKILLHDASRETSSIVSLGQNTATPKRPKIAIVGMAGRFPNAADHEKFWNLLEAGLDVHRKVLHPNPGPVLALTWL